MCPSFSGRGGAGGGAKQVIIEPHRHAGIFIAKKGKGDDMLVTKSLVPGEAVYGEKKIQVEVCLHA